MTNVNNFKTLKSVLCSQRTVPRAAVFSWPVCDLFEDAVAASGR